mgnify:CR=1 FL=1
MLTILDVCYHQTMQATLAQVRHAGNRLNISCDGCGKYRQVDPADLIERLGDAFPIPRLKRVLRCQLCGAKQADVKIAINMKPFALPGQ